MSWQISYERSHEHEEELRVLSTCPSCLSQVNHADHLFDVTCECGAHFSPYLNVDDSSSSGPSAQKSNSFSEYVESGNAFSEIVKFGEGLGTELETPIEPKPSPIPNSNGALPSTGTFSAKQTITPLSANDVLLSTGSELSGYVIQTHFPPISVVTSFSMGGTNPIQPGVDLLWKQAAVTGANAIVGLQTTLTPDGRNILLIGIPVFCSKVV